ncbi:MAG: radical SAM protein [Bacteroidaceae bacterium]|nr:radical SAM protein [Bacteroidaceae bacterium]
MSNSIYYRPEWTSGRYDAEHHATIFYNLVTGYSYFYDELSADVMGMILAAPRNNGTIRLYDISTELDISINSLIPFFQDLEEQGLVSEVPISKGHLAEYRQRISKSKCEHTMLAERSVQEKLPFDVSNAEMAYTKMVGGITSVMFELTYNCSERCIHCYNEGATRNDQEISHRGDRKELEFEDYKQIIDELYEQGLFKVCLTGGDPFSKPFAWEIIDYLYNKGVVFDIFTNGQRIINDVERLANYYPRTVGVSIYSGKEGDHDYITRVKGSWKKSVSVVKQLSELAVPLNLKCCVMQPNVKTYWMVADLAKQYGAIAQFEVSLTDSVEGDKCVSKYLRLSPEQLEIVLRDNNIPLYVGKEAPNYGGQKKKMDSNPCGAGDNSFCITPEGNVIPCCAFHTIFGNVKERSIKDIVHCSKELHWWNSLTLKQYEECGQHDYCDYCNLCPGNNFHENGTPLKASENNCYMAKVRYELAQKMISGYDPIKGKALQDKLAELPDYVPKVLKREYSLNFSDTKLKAGG